MKYADFTLKNFLTWIYLLILIEIALAGLFFLSQWKLPGSGNAVPEPGYLKTRLELGIKYPYMHGAVYQSPTHWALELPEQWLIISKTEGWEQELPRAEADLSKAFPGEWRRADGRHAYFILENGLLVLFGKDVYVVSPGGKQRAGVMKETAL